MVCFRAVLAIGLLLVSAPVVVHLEASEGLEPAVANAVVRAMARGIETSSKRDVAIDDAKCERADTCANDIATRFGADQVVLVRLLGAVQTGRARVVRTGKASGRRRVDLDFPLDDENAWPAIFGGLGRILFAEDVPPLSKAEEKTPPAEKLTANVDPPSSTGNIVAWSAVGAGVVLGAVATGFRLSANNVRDDVNGLPIDDPMRPDLESRSNAHGLSSNLMFGAGAVLVASGLVYLFTR